MECKRSKQVAVTGILTLPECMTDIDFILRVTSTPIIDNATVINKQISFCGHVLICIEFVSSKSDCPQTVHFISTEIPFIGLLDHCCARASMGAELSASIKHQEFNMLTPRCVNQLIMVKISLIRLTKSCESLNVYYSEPCLTLLCQTASPSTQPLLTSSISSIDSHSDPIDFHLPQTLEICTAEHVTKSSCSICGCKIDPV